MLIFCYLLLYDEYHNHNQNFDYRSSVSCNGSVDQFYRLFQSQQIIDTINRNGYRW